MPLKNFLISLVFVLVGASHPWQVNAEEAAITTSTEEPGWFDRWFDRFVDIHDTTSRRYINMTRAIDSYFSGETTENSKSTNYLKLEMLDTLYKGGQHEDDISLKAKLRLPNTENNLQLVFTSSLQEEQTLEDRVQGNADGKRISKESSVAGIEYVPETPESSWEKTYTAGIKLRFSGLIPVARYKIKRSWDLEDKWSSQFEQSFWYIDDEGFGATNEMVLYRPLNDKHTLALGSEIEFKDYSEESSQNPKSFATYNGTCACWRKVTQEIEYEDMHIYGLTITDYQRIDATRGLQYQFGALGESRPVNAIASYFVSMTYRKALYKDWLLLAAGPQLSFPREENWQPQPSFTVLLQVYFSE